MEVNIQQSVVLCEVLVWAKHKVQLIVRRSKVWPSNRVGEPALLDRMAWKAPGKNQDNTGIKHQCLGCPFGGVTSVVTAVRKSSYCHLLVTLHAALPTFHLKFQGFCWSQCKTDALNFFFLTWWSICLFLRRARVFIFLWSFVDQVWQLSWVKKSSYYLGWQKSLNILISLEHWECLLLRTGW